MHLQGPFGSRGGGQLPGQRHPAGGASGAGPGGARGGSGGSARIAGLPAGGVSAGAPSPAASPLCSLPGGSSGPLGVRGPGGQGAARGDLQGEQEPGSSAAASAERNRRPLPLTTPRLLRTPPVRAALPGLPAPPPAQLGFLG